MLGMSVAIFAMTEILPGDAASAILGQFATPESLAVLREKMGLDEPVHIRYFTWLTGFLVGDFGDSLMRGSPVSDLIVVRGSTTLLIAGLAALVSIPFAVFLGIYAAYRENKRADRWISALCLIGVSVPEFLTALVLVAIFSITLGWLPALVTTGFDDDLSSMFRALALPLVVIFVSMLAYIARMTRNAMLNVLGSPAIEMAYLKGVPSRRIILLHALPNAIGPIATVLALEMAHLIAGVVVIEAIFNINGMGRLMVEAVGGRDEPVVQACAMIFCSAYILFNLAADLISIAANPRIRHPK